MSAEDGKDLQQAGLEDKDIGLEMGLDKMPMSQLAGYTSGYNVFVSNGPKEGILIGYLDMEPSPERVKVLVDGEQEYWTDDQSKYVRTENRKWEKA